MLQREGRQIEYKEKLSNYKGIIKTIIAFSNDIGGTIFIGIEDRQRTVIGLEEAELEKYLEEIPQAIYDAISPYCMPNLSTQTLNDKTVLHINVVPGARKPYFLKSEGTHRGSYIRAGAHTKCATTELLEDLFRQGQRRWWDEELQESLQTTDLDQEALRSFYRGNWSEAQLIADKAMAINPMGEKNISNAGVLFFHPDPCTLLPQAEVLYSQFAGDKMDIIVKTVDLSAPLPQLAEQCIQLLRPLLTLATKRKNLTLQDSSWEIPLVALREAIINALIHRQYAQMDAIKIALFDNRVEIFSPGNFPGPMIIDELGNGVSFSLNPHLRQLARRASLVEKRGFGYRLIFDACSNNGNPKPLVEEGPTFVKVTFFREIVETDKVEEFPRTLQALSKLATQQQTLQTKDAAALLDVSLSTARSHLKQLVAQGWLRAEGKGRTARYVWLKHPVKADSE